MKPTGRLTNHSLPLSAHFIHFMHKKNIRPAKWFLYFKFYDENAVYVLTANPILFETAILILFSRWYML
jgi:GR25 family glycosyltransferase involved in LPS biosynthesis